jgi:hypothetical protein
MVFTVAGWTLQDIITEARGITGRPDTSMMSDQTVVDFINRYYQYVLPKELKVFWGYTYYQFFTVANIDQYPVPGVGANGQGISFQTFNPAAYCDGFPMEWNTDPDTFFSDYPQQENKVVVATGTGLLNSFTFQIPAYPVLARSVYVTDGIQVATDVPTGTTGTGTFVDSATGNTLTGTINYASGAVSGLAFLAIPAANTNITCTSQTYMPTRPQEILFYKMAPLVNATMPVRDGVNMFVLRPVPDQVYLIKLEGIQVPPPLINYTDVPFRSDLGPLIALGASIHIFKVFNQMDQIDLITPEYNRYKDVCMQDTYEEYLYERSVPKF